MSSNTIDHLDALDMMNGEGFFCAEFFGYVQVFGRQVVCPDGSYVSISSKIKIDALFKAFNDSSYEESEMWGE